MRAKPLEEDLEDETQKGRDSSITRGEVSKSDLQNTKRSDQSKRHRRANNRSRLYEDEQKLFENIVKTKNNQSLDMKLDQNMPKHIKYTTLLSKDKKLKIADKHEAPKDVSAGDKNSQISTSKYFSAPVSTKENGLVTQFKFQEKITNNKEERPRHKRSKEVKVKSKGSSGRASAESKHRRGKMSMNTSQESIFNHSKNQSQVIEQKKVSEYILRDSLINLCIGITNL